MGTYGTKVQFSQSSLVHEAKLKDGELAEGFDISESHLPVKRKRELILSRFIIRKILRVTA